MSQELINWVEAPQVRTDIPYLPIGATVRVNYRIREGEKERTQAFEGVVIRKHNGQNHLNSTFTVRKTSMGQGVERIFPVHSPRIEKVDVRRHAKVRRAKLYFLRSRSGKKARLGERTRGLFRD